MNFLKKYGVWILITIVLLVLIVVMMRKKKQSGQDRTREQGARGTWGLGYIDNRAGTTAAIAIGSPRPQMGMINVGDMVAIEDAGPWSGTFSVNKVWQDANGNLGAIYIEAPGTENMPVNNNIQTYSNTGKIYLI